MYPYPFRYKITSRYSILSTETKVYYKISVFFLSLSEPGSLPGEICWFPLIILFFPVTLLSYATKGTTSNSGVLIFPCDRQRHFYRQSTTLSSNDIIRYGCRSYWRPIPPTASVVATGYQHCRRRLMPIPSTVLTYDDQHHL